MEWTRDALVAVIVALVAAAAAMGGDWAVIVSLSPLGVELSAPTLTARFVVNF